MGTNTDSNNWTPESEYGVRNLGTLSPKWVSINAFPSRFRETLRRENGKTGRVRGDGGCEGNKAF